MNANSAEIEHQCSKCGQAGICSAHLHDASDLLHFTLPREEGIACVEFGKDAAQAPHVNGHAVRVTQDDLRRAVEATLDVGVN